MSKFLERQQQLANRTHRIPSAVYKKRCDILAVYDSDFNGEIPDKVKELQIKFPGYLFAKVQLVEKRGVDSVFYVPFGDSIDYIYTNIGNSLEIVKHQGMLTVVNNNFNASRLYIVKDKEELMSVKDKRTIFDIGRI